MSNRKLLSPILHICLYLTNFFARFFIADGLNQNQIKTSLQIRVNRVFSLKFKSFSWFCPKNWKIPLQIIELNPRNCVRSVCDKVVLYFSLLTMAATIQKTTNAITLKGSVKLITDYLSKKLLNFIILCPLDSSQKFTNE